MVLLVLISGTFQLNNDDDCFNKCVSETDAVHEVAAVSVVWHDGRVRGDTHAFYAGDTAHEAARHYRAG